MEIGIISSLCQLLVATLFNGHLSDLWVSAEDQLSDAFEQLNVHLVIGNILDELDQKLPKTTLRTDFLNISNSFNMLSR